MSDSIREVSRTLLASQVSQALQVAAAKRNLDQQKIDGQAALKLVDAAAAPVDPNIGRNIDTVA